MVHPKTENIRLSFQTKEVPAALFHPVKANAVKHHKKKSTFILIFMIKNPLSF